MEGPNNPPALSPLRFPGAIVPPILPHYAFKVIGASASLCGRMRPITAV